MKDRSVYMQVYQAHNESVFVWRSIVVSAASEHGIVVQIFVRVTYVLEVVTNMCLRSIVWSCLL